MLSSAYVSIHVGASEGSDAPWSARANAGIGRSIAAGIIVVFSPSWPTA